MGLQAGTTLESVGGLLLSRVCAGFVIDLSVLDVGVNVECLEAQVICDKSECRVNVD